MNIRFILRGDFWQHAGNQAARLARVLGLTLVKDHDGQPIVFFPEHRQAWAKEKLKEAGITARFAPPPGLKPATRYRMRKRKHWRMRALESTHQLVTWQTGAPDRDECASEVAKSLEKIQEWFTPQWAARVAYAIQRRAIHTFNTSQ